MSEPLKKMNDGWQVMRTAFTMREGMSYTDAVVRAPDGVEVRIRIGGNKTEPEHETFLIDEAKLQRPAMPQGEVGKDLH